MNSKEILRETEEILGRGRKGPIYIQSGQNGKPVYFAVMSPDALESGRIASNFAASERINVEGFLSGKNYSDFRAKFPEVSIFYKATFPEPEKILIVRPKEGKRIKKLQRILARTRNTLDCHIDGPEKSERMGNRVYDLNRRELKRLEFFRYDGKKGGIEETHVYECAWDDMEMVAVDQGIDDQGWYLLRGMRERRMEKGIGNAVARPTSVSQPDLLPDEIYSLTNFLGKKEFSRSRMVQVSHAVFLPEIDGDTSVQYDKGKLNTLFAFRRYDLDLLTDYESESEEATKEWFSKHKNKLTMTNFGDDPDEAFRILKKALKA